MTPSPSQPQLTDVQRSIIRNNYKLTADKIIQILEKLRENAHLANRRWVWELLQNAKDVRNAFGQVRVDIRLTEDSLSFRHNGDPFEVEHLTGLIQQVSSKVSDGSDEETTGKFGTGFISTHLLADVIAVGGVVKRADDQHRKFQLTLDRSGTTSEVLLDSISGALDRILTLDENEVEFPLLPAYTESRQVDDLHTEFCYVLHTEENREAAEAGIADLVHTLPGTLLNIPRLKIKEVRVSMPNGSVQTYDVARTEAEGNVVRYTISIATTDATGTAADTRHRYFLAYETDELRLLAEVTDFDSLTLVPPSAEQPALYRDFPLIGSEKFHFPFALNGFNFFPTEERDGILLNGNTEKPTHNRQLVVAAQAAALAFTEWLLERGARNRFVLANTRLPEVGMDPKSVAWYEELQSNWRKALLDLPLVESAAGTTVPLRGVRVPRLRANAKIDDNVKLWALAVGFLGLEAVPQLDMLPAWVKALGVEDELPSWSKTLFLDTTDLLRLVAERKTLGALNSGGDETAALAWLNHLYAYLAEHKQLDLLKLYAAVPNQQGDLCLLDKLYVERADELIPAPVLDVLHSLGLPWREDLLRREVVLPEYKHQDRGLREATAEINTVLKVRESVADKLEMGFLQRADAEQVLVALLRLTSTNADDSTFRSKLFGFAKELLHFEEEPLTVESLKYFDFGKATQLLTLHVNQTISNQETLVGLAVALKTESEDEARSWLGRYLRFVADSGTFKPLLEFGNIVPNRKGTLCAYADLYNYGTATQPLDDTLLHILHDFDRTKPHWLPRLLADGIGLTMPLGAYKFDEVGTDLMLLVDGVGGRREHVQYRDQLLRLLDWSNDHQALAKQYLGQFFNESGRLFYILTIEQSDKSREVMRLMRNPERISDLAAIADSGADVAKLRQLAELTSSDSILNQVLRFAQQLEADVASFAFLQSIGAQMEEAFLDALKDAGVIASIERGDGTTATVAQIDYQGIGSYDFVVRSSNGKAFYIELKSHKKDNPHPIRLAQSQTKRAAAGTEPFALCVIGREGNPADVDTAYVREHLRYVTDLQTSMAPVAAHIGQLEAMELHHSPDVWLDVTPLHGTKVFVTLDFINARAKSFELLIQDITTALR